MAALIVPEWTPDKNLLDLLESMLEAARVDAAQEGLRRYPKWVSQLAEEDTATIVKLKLSLVEMRSIEQKHGSRACLVLDHSNVKRLIECGLLARDTITLLNLPPIQGRNNLP